MRFGSLFAGIGGFDIGLEAAGMTSAFQVELDPFATSVLEKHWPDVPRWRDVKTFPPPDGDWNVDLLCGGFPCQSVSTAGRRKGDQDDRWLWPEMRRVCAAIGRPRWLLLENVVGLLSAGDVRGDLFGGILRDVASLGYAHIEWHCLSARAVAGAPHVRDRVWVLATTEQREGPILPGDLADAHSAGVRGRGNELRVAGTGGQGRKDTATHGHPHSGGRDAGPQIGDVPDANSVGSPGPWQPEPPVCSASPEDGEACHPRDGGVTSQWGVECRLGRDAHGLPDGVDECRGWECGVPRVTPQRRGQADRLKALGNSVVPQVVEFIGRRIMQADAEQVVALRNGC